MDLHVQSAQTRPNRTYCHWKINMDKRSMCTADLASQRFKSFDYLHNKSFTVDLMWCGFVSGRHVDSMVSEVIPC